MRAHGMQEHGPILHLTFLGCRQPASGLPSDMLQHLSRVADVQRKWIFVEVWQSRAAGLLPRWGMPRVVGSSWLIMRWLRDARLRW